MLPDCTTQPLKTPMAQTSFCLNVTSLENSLAPCSFLLSLLFLIFFWSFLFLPSFSPSFFSLLPTLPSFLPLFFSSSLSEALKSIRSHSCQPTKETLNSPHPHSSNKTTNSTFVRKIEFQRNPRLFSEPPSSFQGHPEPLCSPDPRVRTPMEGRTSQRLPTPQTR